MCLSVSASFVIFQKSETCYISLVFPEAPLKRFLQNVIWGNMAELRLVRARVWWPKRGSL